MGCFLSTSQNCQIPDVINQINKLPQETKTPYRASYLRKKHIWGVDTIGSPDQG
ncbi:predicted protein [Sclerotinia sclerotiorum 1980 UF-70]|uniref:Uncharacterized protein n=1 Tax=Sclerotinia sclerotiorum (strain ATCC 18683 / 1980 / Ss-1) TaxID=665079 RepID=A7F557_SCLS1|nr:predicted protein [Sclerotinia sclerotiorum 1980 UF-70]EDN97878.1 predicted protein [Sclerotinia sclerotiorum 1980 UF-70]